MKRLSGVFSLSVFLILAVPASFGAKSGTSQDQLLKQATVTKEAATKIALDRVPNGIIKEAELEKEHGILVWSFDISNPNSKDITEIQVDAKTSKVVSVKKESAKAEKKEQKIEPK